jgi:endonuclease YncB( thermonuclease family)
MTLALVVAVAMSFSFAAAQTTDVSRCSFSERIACLVDGDTIWYEGIKIHLEDIDMPKRGALAGCMNEALLSSAATHRLAELLSAGYFTIETEDKFDNYDRVQARLLVNGVSVGETLIAEGLARRSAGQQGDWCE